METSELQRSRRSRRLLVYFVVEAGQSEPRPLGMPLDSQPLRDENLSLPESAMGMGLVGMDEQVDVTNRGYGPDVMISYSSHDRAQVMQFTQRLRAAGVAAWIDQGGIDGAQKWGEEIVNAIDSCKTVILMISQISMQSENINKEVMLAWENGKHFLPLCLEDAKIPKSMQYQLAGIQQIKLYEGDPEAKFVAVLRALVRLGVHVSPYYIALVSADLGDREQAIEWLNKAVEQRSSGLSRLKTEGRFNMLRGDPRFAQVLAKAESLPLEPENVVPDVPAYLAGPVVVRAAEPKPARWWKKIAWPEVVNDVMARQAAAQGVWAAAFLIVGAILGVMFGPSPTPGMPAAGGITLSAAILGSIIFGAIGFGVQKMGRPAAVIGLVLCSFGALQNLTNLQAAGTMRDSIALQYHQYEQYVQSTPGAYENPAITQAYDRASSAYDYSWFALLVSLVCVGAFTNATRGTFGYRRMVVSRLAADKQDAITGEDLAAIKGKIAGRFGKSRGAGTPSPVMAPPARVSTMPSPARTVPQYNAAATVPSDAPVPLAAVQPIAVPAETPPQVQVAVAPAPLRQGFAAMIGVSGGVVYWPRVGAFWLANVAAALTFLISRIATAVPVPPLYWLFSIGVACVFTIATVVGFRYLPKGWAAAGCAAAATTIAALPFYAALPTFAWADLVYREQFQQFILLPFANSFILLMALVWVVPRLQPMVLALWLAAMGTEIAASLVSNLLRALGAGDPPDTVLGGASVISAMTRSLAFAVVLWGGLQYLRKQSAAAG